LFEREWLINLILFGNYNKLRDLALDQLSHEHAHISGNTLQIACVYGTLTAKLIARMLPDAQLKVVDIVPIQLENLSSKIELDARVSLERSDSSKLPYADASQDQALLFFLLHEQPEATRRETLREALRVVKPGGKVVIVDYHKPYAFHPLRPLLRQIFKHLEPFAMDLWQHGVEDYLPADIDFKSLKQSTNFGGLYQVLVLERS
jgi:ubiquinone/menaquinone biosynthesis C-methylase UbiE